MTSTFKQPQVFVPGPNPAESWQRWRRRFEVYFSAADLASKPVSQQRSILLHVIGEQGFELYHTLNIPQQDDARTVQVVLDAFTVFYRPYKNTTYMRYVFFTSTQSTGQSVDDFITDLKVKAQDCDFGELTDSLIRDRIVCGITNDTLRERLLQEPNLSLPIAADMCRAFELSKAQTQSLSSAEGTSVQAVQESSAKYWKQNKKQIVNSQARGDSKASGQPRKFNMVANRKSADKGSGQNKKCSRCGTVHTPRQCPAYGKKCLKCGKINHFANSCKLVVMQISEDISPEDNDSLFIGALTIDTEQNRWIEKVTVQGVDISFTLDTGSQVNILPANYFEQLKEKPTLRPAVKTITSYSGHAIPVDGTCTLQCTFGKLTRDCHFYIISQKARPILGVEAATSLNLINRVQPAVQAIQTGNIPDSSRALLEEYQDVFQGLGSLPWQHHITMKEDAVPKIHAARKIPVALESKVKQELDKMEREGIIARIEEPTDWVHPIVAVMKPDDSVRICMDPRNLNEAIKREHHSLPTSDTIFAKLKGSTVFTVMDASSAFWQIPLDEESSKLCTIATPYGRYRFLRMPFGISSAPEIFQRTLETVLQGIPGQSSSMDDILVHGKDVTEHDQHLRQVLERVRQHNMKLGNKKLQLAKENVRFLGFRITADGIQVEQSKVTAITALKSPTNVTELRRFLGMIQFLAKFIPNLSQETSYLRQLLHKNVAWQWDLKAEEDFVRLKMLISKAPVLRFYDPKQPCTISVDASQYGLGSVLLQKGQPIAYSSTALTATQRGYAQIEKELLSIVTACEHYHYYVYGTDFEVQTDHKPLLAIVKKPMEVLSPRLQRMVLRLMRYQPHLTYVPGKHLYIADALSRDPDASNVVDTSFVDNENLSVHTLIAATPSKLQQLQESTKNDIELVQVKEFITHGWPTHKSSAKSAVKYWHCKEELQYVDGLILRGIRIVIPTSQRPMILDRLHEAHQGVNSVKNKARATIYWPGMSKDIEDKILSCSICQQTARANTKEPLTPHAIPELPWEKIGIDFVHIDNDVFVVIVDYHSKYIEMQKMLQTTASKIISVLKSVFARHGIPMEIMSDNGPPFDSKEFETFTKEWDILHNTSSPTFASSNGMIERAIQTLEGLLKKAKLSGTDPHLALLEYRATPKDNLPSPAEMLMGRKLRSRLPITRSNLKPHFETLDTVARLHQNQQKQKKFADRRRPSKLQPLEKGQLVLYQRGTRQWHPSRIAEVGPQPNSFTVSTPEGAQYRRNRIHLRSFREPQPSGSTQATPTLNAANGTTPTRDKLPEVVDDQTRTTSNDAIGSMPTIQVQGPQTPVCRTTRSGRVVTTPIRYRT